jgi:pyruvate/2-oxoglutarate dehydrogenase complex dihydrolipoamide acyltransferase (E2) component
MKTLKALKGHSYGGKFRPAGSIYNASSRDANLLVLVKTAEYHSAPEVVTAPFTVKVDAESDIDLSQIQGTGINGRVLKRDIREYKTRMMIAE